MPASGNDYCMREDVGIARTDGALLSYLLVNEL